MPYGLLAGIDVGTTSVKVLLMTPDGRDVAVGRMLRPPGRAPPRARRPPPRPSRARLRPAQPMPRPGAPAPASSVSASRAWPSRACWSTRPTCLAPVIAWHDTRDSAELASLIATLSGEEFSRRTGLPLWTQWSATKHRWMRAHLPETTRATRRYNVARSFAGSAATRSPSSRSHRAPAGWTCIPTAVGRVAGLVGRARLALGDLVDAGVPVGYAQGAGPLAAVSVPSRPSPATTTKPPRSASGAPAGDEFDSAERQRPSCGPAIRTSSTAPLPTSPQRASPSDAMPPPAAGAPLGATQGGLILGRVQHALGVDRTASPPSTTQPQPPPTSPRRSPSAPARVMCRSTRRRGEVWRAATRAA